MGTDGAKIGYERLLGIKFLENSRIELEGQYSEQLVLPR